MTIVTKSLLGIAGLALAALSTPSVLASGTVGGGNAAQNGARMGQSVYSSKIACKRCMYPGGLTKANADMALMKINNGEIMLSASEKTAVTNYINRRFKGM